MSAYISLVKRETLSSGIPEDRVEAKRKGNTIRIISGNTAYELKIVSQGRAARKALDELCKTLNQADGVDSAALRMNFLSRLKEGRVVFRITPSHSNGVFTGTSDAKTKRIKLEYAAISRTEQQKRLIQIGEDVSKISQTRFFQFGKKASLKEAVAGHMNYLREETQWKGLNDVEALPKPDLPASLPLEEPSSAPPPLPTLISPALVSPPPEGLDAGLMHYTKGSKAEEAHKERITREIVYSIQGVHMMDEAVHPELTRLEDSIIGNARVHHQVNRDFSRVTSDNIRIVVNDQVISMETVEASKEPWLNAVRGVRGEEDIPLSDQTAVDLMGIMTSQTFIAGITEIASSRFTYYNQDKAISPFHGQPSTAASLSIVGDQIVITRTQDFCLFDMNDLPERRTTLGDLESAEAFIEVEQVISIPLSSIRRLEENGEGGLKGLSAEEVSVTYDVKKTSPKKTREEIVKRSLVEAFIQHARDQGSKKQEWELREAANQLIEQKELQQLIKKRAKGNQPLQEQSLSKITEEAMQKIAQAKEKGSTQTTSLNQNWQRFSRNTA